MHASNWTRVLFEAIDDAVFVHDAEGNILEANPAACRRLGYTREELLRLNTRDIDDPDFAKGFAGRLQSQLSSGRMRCEGVHRAKDGRRIDVDINTSAFTFDGKPAVLAVMRDITEHKRVEKELSDSQALYQSLVQSLPQNILRKDRDSRLIFGNERYCAGLKRPLADLLGKTDFDLFPAETARKYVRDDQMVMDSGQTLDTIEEHYLPDGKRLYVHVVKTPVFNAANEVIGVQGIFWDVTQEVLAHEAVAHSEKRYRQLTEATMDGIVVIDPDGKVVLFNPAAERMFGYRADEILGQPARLLIPDEFEDLHAQGVQRYLARRLHEMFGRPQEFKGKHRDCN